MTVAAPQVRPAPDVATAPEPEVRRAATPDVRRAARAHGVQFLLSVSHPDDPSEQEAAGFAARVQAAPAPPAGGTVHRAPDQSAAARAPVGRAPGPAPSVVAPVVAPAGGHATQRTPEPGPAARAAVDRAPEPARAVSTLPAPARPGGAVGRASAPAVRRASSGPAAAPRTLSGLPAAGAGTPVPAAVRDRIEPHLGTGLDTVRVHTGPEAARAARGLGARAFTHRDQIFLGPRESPDDVALMAHEAAHVVQQGAAEPDQVHRMPGFLSRLAEDVVTRIPFYDALTLVFGYDPIRDVDVPFTPVTVMRAVLGILPGGSFIADALERLGVLGAIGDLVKRGAAEYRISTARLRETVEQAVDEMELFRWDVVEHNLGVIKRHLAALVADLTGFGGYLFTGLLAMVKEAALRAAEGLLDGTPLWSLVKKVIHYDPLRGVEVTATTAEILADFLRLIGREQELLEMQKRGTLQRTADWLDTQLATFSDLVGQLQELFAAAWAAIQPENLPNLMSDLDALAGRAMAFLRRVGDFAGTVAGAVLKLIKDALLGWLSSFAHELPGFELFTVVLGRNPFTGEKVPRTAENLIRGFITLLPGGDETYARLAESGVVGQAAARIEGAIAKLGISWDLVRETFLGIWNGLSIEDLIDPIAAFERIRAQFGEPVGRLVAFVSVVLQEIITLLLAMMNFPGDIVARIMNNILAAFEDITRDPVGFLLNMLRAVRIGFGRFFDKILVYLLDGLRDWLFRQLGKAGIEPPKELTVESVLAMVGTVLGLSLDTLWTKLAAKIGQEKVDKLRGAIDKLEGIWSFVSDVRERGFGALWEKLQERLGDLWGIVLEKVRSWIMEKIVDRVVAKLLSMLDPTGVMAVVNGFMAFFNAVQSALEYVRELLLIVDDYVSTIASVARGDVEPGAVKIEQGLAGAIPVAIGFLANQVGLGNVGDKLAEMIASLREMVDKALDWLVDKAIQLGKAALDSIGQAVGLHGPPVDEPVPMGGTTHHLRNDGPSGELVLHSNAMLVSAIQDKDFQKLVAAYNQVRELTVDKNGKLRGMTKRDKAARAVGEWIAKHGLPSGPGGSAPGLGNVQRHGHKPPSVYPGIPLWTLESEHVVPFMIVFGAWRVLGIEEGASREALGVEDRALTTIMIYEGAASGKTSAEVPLRDAADARLDKLKAEYELEGDVDTVAGDARAEARTDALIEEFRVKFVALTWQHVQKEHATPSAASHGAARGEASPLPTEGKIGGAATAEVQDARKILHDALRDQRRKSPVKSIKPPPTV